MICISISAMLKMFAMGDATIPSTDQVRIHDYS